jgi:hypothetical protein
LEEFNPTRPALPIDYLNEEEEESSSEEDSTGGVAPTVSQSQSDGNESKADEEEDI